MNEIEQVPASFSTPRMAPSFTGQGQGHSSGSDKDTSQGLLNGSSSLIIHREETSNDSGSSSRTAMDAAPRSVEERRPSPTQFMDDICFLDGPSEGGLDMVDRRSKVMERPELDMVDTRRGSLHRASDAGWGLVNDQYAKSGIWTRPLLLKHINYKELMVV